MKAKTKKMLENLGELFIVTCVSSYGAVTGFITWAFLNIIFLTLRGMLENPRIELTAFGNAFYGFCCVFAGISFSILKYYNLKKGRCRL